MYLSFVLPNQFTLHELDNFREFHCVLESGEARDREEVIKRLGIDGNNEFLIDKNKVIAISGNARDKQWVQRFNDMLAVSEKYGYYDSTSGWIKVHCKEGN